MTDTLIKAEHADLIALLKVDGQWKIMNKVFHLYSNGEANEA